MSASFAEAKLGKQPQGCDTVGSMARGGFDRLSHREAIFDSEAGKNASLASKQKLESKA